MAPAYLGPGLSIDLAVVPEHYELRLATALEDGLARPGTWLSEKLPDVAEWSKTGPSDGLRDGPGRLRRGLSQDLPDVLKRPKRRRAEELRIVPARATKAPSKNSRGFPARAEQGPLGSETFQTLSCSAQQLRPHVRSKSSITQVVQKRDFRAPTIWSHARAHVYLHPT